MDAHYLYALPGRKRVKACDALSRLIKSRIGSKSRASALYVTVTGAKIQPDWSRSLLAILGQADSLQRKISIVHLSHKYSPSVAFYGTQRLPFVLIYFVTNYKWTACYDISITIIFMSRGCILYK